MNRAELDALIAERDDALRRLRLQDAECAHMRAERDAARAECDALRAFARAVLEGWPESAPDGFELQELAIEHGMLVGSTVTAPCGDECQCAEYHGASDMAEGVICYRRSPLLGGTR